MTTLLVGYTANRKKQKHFFDGLAAAAHSWVGVYGPRRTPVSVRLVSLSDHVDLGDSPRLRLHAVIHKRTDDMAAAVARRDHAAAERVRRLDAFLRTPAAPIPVPHPEGHAWLSPGAENGKLVAVDPLQGVWRLLDRRHISEAVDRAFGPAHLRTIPNVSETVRALPWTLVPLRQGPDAVRRAVEGKLHFPIILKRSLACGTKSSHEMVIAYDMDGCLAAVKAVFGNENSLSSVESTDILPPDGAEVFVHEDFGSHAIAQEFITNHGGVLFKVYAIGEKVVVQPRSSVQHSIKAPTGGYYYFDSQRLYRGDQGNDFSFDASSRCSKATEAIMPSPKLASSTVEALSRELRLSLIGVDLVYDTHSKNYYVVDINYFPGYKGVTTAYEWLLEHICNLVWQRLEEQ